MPAHTPPHKPSGEDPGAEHRLRMCELLVAGTDGLSACSLEIDRGGPSYTVDTLRAVHASHPDAELTFIVGADVASTIASWREPQALLALSDLAVVPRDGFDPRVVLETIARIEPSPAATAATGTPAPTVSFLEMERIDASSSMARERAARGEPLEDLVGSEVARYIAEHSLYRPRSEEGG